MGLEQVYRQVADAGELGATRYEIARRLGINKAAVQRLVAQLLAAGRIEQSATFKRRGAAVLYAPAGLLRL